MSAFTTSDAPVVLRVAAQCKREHAELLSMVKRMRLSFTALRIMNGDLGPAARSQCGQLEREAGELIKRIEGAKA